MLSSVDPCEDFYEHVCGGWIHETLVPPESAAIDVFIEAQRNVQDEIMGTFFAYRDRRGI